MTVTEQELPVRHRHTDELELWNKHNRFVSDMTSLGDKVYAVDVEITLVTRMIVGAEGPDHAAVEAVKGAEHAFQANANHDAKSGEVLVCHASLVAAEEIDPHGYVDRFGRPVAVSGDYDEDRKVVTFTYGDGSRRCYGLAGYEGPIATREDGPLVVS